MSLVLDVHFWQGQLESDGEQTPPPLPGGPVDLAHAARLCLQWLLRRGPQATQPARAEIDKLLTSAAQAVNKGWVPCWLPWRLRQDLQDIAHACRTAHYQPPDRPLWWEPLPLFQADWWHTADAKLTASWQAALATHPPNRWCLLDALLPDDHWSHLGARLEQLFSEGAIDLQPAGVGAAGTRTAVRSDAVQYLTGNESWLWRHLPALGALVTWSRTRLPIVLSEALVPAHQALRLVAPQRAMLARYPAPSGGYARHLDNPGGAADNGRAWTLVMYLGQPDANQGGDIVLYDLDGNQPRLQCPPRDRNAVLFDARQIPHQVEPLTAGPARWALSIWFTDHPQATNPFTDMALPRLEPEQVIAAWDHPEPPADRLLLHQLTEEDTRVHRIERQAKARMGLVSTVYAAGDWLADWCHYHLQCKVNRIVLIFDRADLPQEAATMARIREQFKDQPVTLWSAATAQQHWQALPDTAFVRQLRPLAALGTQTSAICARQSLNAGAVLYAMENGRLPAVDWLAHIDADEYLHFAGGGRGGANAEEHAAALSASGWQQVRYLNHELLLRETPGPVRFKCHPRVAQRKLGRAGWQALKASLGFGSDDRKGKRHYFGGYLNGKGAIAVQSGAGQSGAGQSGAGQSGAVQSGAVQSGAGQTGAMGAVHGWIDSQGSEPVWLDGPHILHAHNPSAEAFSAKMRRRYASGADQTLDETLFPPGPLDREAQAQLQADPDADLRQLYRQRTLFNEAICALLSDAGLLIKPPAAVAAILST